MTNTPQNDHVADLLTAMGELAAELEDVNDPAREAQLRTQLAELDKVLDHLLIQAHTRNSR